MPHTLVECADHQLLASHCQRAREHSLAQPPRQLPAGEFRDAGRSSDINRALMFDDCQHLWIRQAFRFAEAIGLARAEIENTAIERSNPQVAFIAGERSDVKALEAGMKGTQRGAIEGQQPAFFCADQNSPARKWQHSGHAAVCGIARTHLAKRVAIEDQQAFAAGGNQ